MTTYRYGTDDLHAGQHVEVAFATPNGTEWLAATVEDIWPNGRLIIRRDDGGFAPAVSPRSVRVAVE